MSALARRRRRFFILHNPVSGRHRGRLLETVCAELLAAAAIVTVETAVHADDIRRLARQAAASGDFDALVAAGGDGTIRAMAATLVDSEMPLGVIALGTGNVVAHEAPLPRAPSPIARMLLQGPIETVSCGTADGEPFLLMAGAGFDAAVLRRLDTPLKRRIGRLAYAGPVLTELMRPLPTFDVQIDGTPHRCTWLVVANARHYGGPFVIAEGRDWTAPGFHAVVINAPTRLRLLRVLMAIASGRLRHGGDVSIVPCRSVEVEANPQISIQLDGDVSPHRSLHIAEGKLLLRLIVPEATLAKQ